MTRAEAGAYARRAGLTAALVTAAVFAVQGGEFSTTDLLRERATEHRMTVAIARLRRQVDSLQRVKHAVLTDPATQERIAREEFGMVRGDKEILYRFADPPDSAGAGGP